MSSHVKSAAPFFLCSLSVAFFYVLKTMGQNVLNSRRRLRLALTSSLLATGFVGRHSHLVTVLEFRQDDPGGNDGDQGNAKVESNADKVVCTTFRLHGPGDGLAQGFEASQDTAVVGQRGEIGGVLTDEPVQELLKGLATKGPEEDKGVGFAESTGEPVKDGRFGSIIELILEDGGPDPCAGQNGDDGDECDLGTGLDVDALAIEKPRDEERGGDTGKVGEEGGESTRAHGEVGCEPGAEETVVEVADEEGWEEEENATRGQQ